MEVLVKRVTQESNSIKSFELVDPCGGDLPSFVAGAHLDVYLPTNLVRQYSLCNDPDERSRYVIAVRLEALGRGGSKYMHDQVSPGTRLKVSPPRSSFPLVEEAKHHILLAAGVGVTPLKSMMHRLERIEASYVLHLCIRSAAEIPFRDELLARTGEGRIYVHESSGPFSRRVDLHELLRTPQVDAQVYCCGPDSFMQACAAAAGKWPKNSLHFEKFSRGQPAGHGPAAEGGFTVHLKRSDKLLQVSPNSSLADALLQAGVQVETSCRSGLCGACRVPYIDGTVDHQDFVLTEEERSSLLASCVSRATSPLLTLDL